MLKKWNEFKNENKNKIDESLSNLQKEYREYFKFVLKCYDVESPSKLSEDKKKEFFDNIKKYWVKGKGATKDLEEIQIDICGKPKGYKKSN